jgi:predicted nucleic-acid-binding protein
MIALDTDVVIRALTGDHPAQARRVARLFEATELWLPKTVVLEAAWVLRKGYGFDLETVNEALRKLMGLPNVFVEDAPAVIQALDWNLAGLDLADALHMASSREAERLVTFDRAFARKASHRSLAPKVELLEA